MSAFIENNLQLLLTGGFFGAVGGAIFAILNNRSKSSEIFDVAISDNIRTLKGTLETYRNGLHSTEAGFKNVLNILGQLTNDNGTILPGALDGTSPDTFQSSSANTDQAQHEQTYLATDPSEIIKSLLDAVLAIPALPSMPDLGQQFEILKDHPTIGSLFNTLVDLDAGTLNPMLDEFKTLVETTLSQGLNEMMSDTGFSLDEETIDTLIKGAQEFTKLVGGISGGVDNVLNQISQLID